MLSNPWVRVAAHRAWCSGRNIPLARRVAGWLGHVNRVHLDCTDKAFLFNGLHSAQNS